MRSRWVVTDRSFSKRLQLYPYSTTVVKSFFHFTTDEKIGIRNELFDSTYNLKQMMELASIEVKKMGLDRSEQKSPLTETSFKNLALLNFVVDFLLNGQDSSIVSFLNDVYPKFEGFQKKTPLWMEFWFNPRDGSLDHVASRYRIV